MYLSLFLAKKPQTSWKTGWKHWISDLCRIRKLYLVNNHLLHIWIAEKKPLPSARVKLSTFFTYSGSLFPFDTYRNAVKEKEFWCSVTNRESIVHTKRKTTREKYVHNGRHFVMAVDVQIPTRIHNSTTDNPTETPVAQKLSRSKFSQPVCTLLRLHLQDWCWTGLREINGQTVDK